MSLLRLKQLAQDGAANGDAPLWNSAAGRWIPGAPSGGGGGGSLTWTLNVNDPGTSLTGWSTNGTTWSVNTDIQLVTNSAAWRTARFDTATTPMSLGYAVQAEIEVQSTFTTGSYMQVAMIDPAAAAFSSTTKQIGARFAGRSSVEVDIGSTVLQAFTITALTDGWHTLKLVVIGETIVVVVDGTEVGRTTMRGTNITITGATGALKLAVGGYGTFTGRYRNLKGWSISIPLPT